MWATCCSYLYCNLMPRMCHVTSCWRSIDRENIALAPDNMKQRLLIYLETVWNNGSRKKGGCREKIAKLHIYYGNLDVKFSETGIVNVSRDYGSSLKISRPQLNDKRYCVRATHNKMKTPYNCFLIRVCTLGCTMSKLATGV